jgi:hypothetical protein
MVEKKGKGLPDQGQQKNKADIKTEARRRATGTGSGLGVDVKRGTQDIQAGGACLAKEIRAGRGGRQAERPDTPH